MDNDPDTGRADQRQSGGPKHVREVRNVRFGGEAGRYEDDELAQMAHGHSGQGYAEDARRPSAEEILETIKKSPRTRIPGRNAIRIDSRQVRVIINEELPWRSTAYYR